MTETVPENETTRVGGAGRSFPERAVPASEGGGEGGSPQLDKQVATYMPTSGVNPTRFLDGHADSTGLAARVTGPRRARRGPFAAASQVRYK